MVDSLPTHHQECNLGVEAAEVEMSESAVTDSLVIKSEGTRFPPVSAQQLLGF